MTFLLLPPNVVLSSEVCWCDTFHSLVDNGPQCGLNCVSAQPSDIKCLNSSQPGTLLQLNVVMNFGTFPLSATKTQFSSTEIRNLVAVHRRGRYKWVFIANFILLTAFTPKRVPSPKTALNEYKTKEKKLQQIYSRLLRAVNKYFVNIFNHFFPSDRLRELNR